MKLRPTATFVDVAEDLIEDAERRVAMGENPWTLVRDYKKRLKNHCKPYFGQKRISKLTYSDLDEFRRELSKKNLKASSVLCVMSFTSMVFRHALDHGLISQLPKIPRAKHVDHPRPAFSRAQYGRLKRVLKKIEAGNPAVEFKGNVVDKEHRLLITMMMNCFFRPGDVFKLQHKHVEVVPPQGDEPAYLRLNPPASKGHSTPIISMPCAVYIYKNVTAWNAKKGYSTGPNDYVFLPGHLRRAYAQEIVGRQFHKVLQVADLVSDAKGEPHSLYSIRHTAIVTRLILSEGLDLLTLARNCRTSVEMIDRFYASSLTPEMNRHKLHSFRRPTRYAA